MTKFITFVVGESIVKTFDFGTDASVLDKSARTFFAQNPVDAEIQVYLDDKYEHTCYDIKEFINSLEEVKDLLAEDE